MKITLVLCCFFIFSKCFIVYLILLEVFSFLKCFQKSLHTQKGVFNVLFGSSVFLLGLLRVSLNLFFKFFFF